MRNALLAIGCSLSLILMLESGGYRSVSMAQIGSRSAVGESSSDVDGEGAQIEVELAGLAQAVEVANARLTRRTRALYRISRAGVMPLSGGFSALLGHIARVERLERMVGRDLESVRTLRRRVDVLRSQREQARQRAEVERERRTEENAEARASAEEQRQIERVQQLFSPSHPRMAVGRGSFASLRGDLALPLSAPQAIRVATREADGAGLELDGARGAPVHAAASGTVAFAGRHVLYGRLVILDHGGGYFTVYGGLGRIDVELGDALTRAIQLGVVDGEPLFFQVRRGARALDSRVWLGI